MATLKGEEEELVPIQEACVGLTRAMDDEGYETAGKDVKLKKKKVRIWAVLDVKALFFVRIGEEFFL